MTNHLRHHNHCHCHHSHSPVCCVSTYLTILSARSFSIFSHYLEMLNDMPVHFRIFIYFILEDSYYFLLGHTWCAQNMSVYVFSLQHQQLFARFVLSGVVFVDDVEDLLIVFHLHELYSRLALPLSESISRMCTVKFDKGVEHRKKSLYLPSYFSVRIHELCHGGHRLSSKRRQAVRELLARMD